MESGAKIPPGQRTTTGLQHTMKPLSCKLQILVLSVACLDQLQWEVMFVYTTSPKFEKLTLHTPYLERMKRIFLNHCLVACLFSVS